MADNHPTILFNDALKLQTYDLAHINDIYAQELTTAGQTIHLGNVDLENDFSGYMTLGNPNGGLLTKTSTGAVYNMATMTRDSAQVFGDPHTNLYLAFRSDLPAIMTPCFQSGNIVVRSGDNVPGTPTTTTIDGTTVYQLSYDTGTWGFNINVYDTMWDFVEPSTFRVIITELSSGVVTFDHIPDAEFLAGGGFSVPSAGKQAWTAIVPALLIKGLSYNITIQSLSPAFNLMGALYSEAWKPYTVLTGRIFDTKHVPCLPIWQPGTYAVGDQTFYVSESYLDGVNPVWTGKIYSCIIDGAQAGTFADNLDKWMPPTFNREVCGSGINTTASIPLTTSPTVINLTSVDEEFNLEIDPVDGSVLFLFDGRYELSASLNVSCSTSPRTLYTWLEVYNPITTNFDLVANSGQAHEVSNLTDGVKVMIRPKTVAANTRMQLVASSSVSSGLSLVTSTLPNGVVSPAVSVSIRN